MATKQIIDAHKHSSDHKSEIQKSELCGCFYCLKAFPPTKINEWIDGGQTACCPHCGIDSVIGSVSGFPIEESFLDEMCGYWFSD